MTITAHAARCLALLILTPLALPALAQHSPTAGNGLELSYTAPNGQTIQLSAMADDDGDGIDNALEVNGFTYSLVDGLQPWSGDPDVNHYTTNPLRWSTDEDPYSDFTEASGVNMPPNIEAPFNHPLVAARPVISIYMDSYEVVPMAEITDTEGQTISSSYTNETSNEDQVGGSVSAGFSLNPFELASVDVEANYSHTWVNTESTTRDTTVDMSTATTTSPAQAAKLKLRIYYQNTGSAAARNVRPTFNLLLGEKVITTYEANDGEETAGFLAPIGQAESRYPQGNGPGSVIAVGDGAGEDEIILTLDELKAIEAGAPLSLVVTQVEADVPRWNADTNTWECPGECRWATFEGFMNPVSVTMQVQAGDESQEYLVFAGSPQYDPGHTLRDVLDLLFDVEERDGVTYVDGRRYPEAWYASSPSEEVIEAWQDMGSPSNMLDLPMIRRTRFLMTSPGPDPGPFVDFATYTADLRHVLAIARPNGGFPILNAYAVVLTESGERTVPLVRNTGDAFYRTAAPVTEQILGGHVIFEDARGDQTSKRLQAPALARDCAVLKRSLSDVPNPGGEFVVFDSQDVDDGMFVYCAFFDEGGQALGTPITYPLFDSYPGGNGQVVDVHVFDALRAVALDALGAIYLTNDGGETWESAWESSGSKRMHAFSFSDDGLGIAVSEFGAIWRTIDGGQTWTDVTPDPAPNDFSDVAMRDAQTGIAIGSDVMRTTDGGLTWSPSLDGHPGNLTAVDFVGDTAIIVGKTSIHISYDAGQTWSGGGTWARPLGLIAVSMASDSVAIIVDEGGGVWHTYNGGRDNAWHQGRQGMTSATNLIDIDMVSESEAYLVIEHRILHTRNAEKGLTAIWDEVPQRDDQAILRAVDFLDRRVGMIVGGTVTEESVGVGLVLRTRPVNVTAGSPNPDGGTIAPKDLLVYYGWPSSINSTFTVEGASEVFGRYGYVILGDGLQAASHPDHSNTTAILSHSGTSDTKFFGYVDLGVSTQNLPMDQVRASVDAWSEMGVEGIFLDDFGYDFGVTRARQNEAVEYVHDQGLSAVANAWIPDDALGSATDAAFNPAGVPTALGAGDYYFSESYQLREGEYVDGADWRTKADALAAYQQALGIGILSVTTSGAETGYDEERFFYAWYSALLDGHEATGWGEYQYAAVTAHTPYRARPDVAPGAFFLDAPVVNGSIVSRTAENGEIRVDFGTHTYSFGPVTVSLEDPDGGTPARIKLDQNYPNPFNPSTTIAFTITKPGSVRLEVFDLLGRRVSLLANETLPAGKHEVRFDARNLASGVYLYRLTAGSSVELRKMLLLR